MGSGNDRALFLYFIDDSNVALTDFSGTKLWLKEKGRELCSRNFPVSPRLRSINFILLSLRIFSHFNSMSACPRCAQNLYETESSTLITYVQEHIVRMAPHEWNPTGAPRRWHPAGAIAHRAGCNTWSPFFSFLFYSCAYISLNCE